MNTSNIHRIDFGRGALVPLSMTDLLPVGSLVTYEDQANPRRRFIITGGEIGPHGHGQEAICEDGHRAQVHASDPDHYGRSAGPWHFVRDDAGEPVVLHPDAHNAFLNAAEDTRRRIDAEKFAAKSEKERSQTAERARILVEFSFLELAGTSKKSSHALGAANIKRLLAREFPGVAFTVKSKSYSGGDSIDVRWDDGPTHDEVDKFATHFEEGSFDGMTDSYTYGHAVWPEVFGGAKYVHCQRCETEARVIEVAKELGYVITFGPFHAMLGATGHETEQMIYRETRKRSFYVRPNA